MVWDPSDTEKVQSSGIASMKLNQGCPSSNFSATSCGKSASLGGRAKKLRDQWVGGAHWRPRAHVSLIQDSLSDIAWRINEPNETPARCCIWIFSKKQIKSGELRWVLLCRHVILYTGFAVEEEPQQDWYEHGLQAARSIIRFRVTSTKWDESHPSDSLNQKSIVIK